MAKVKIGNVYPTDEYLLERCAPAGYGLGGYCKSINHWDEATACGWYSTANGSPTAATESTVWAGVVTADPITGQITQTVKSQGVYSQGEAVRHYFDNEWTPWEWVNPPLLQGVEYRTTERYMGQPVYAKLVDCGNMLNAEPKTIAHGCGAVIVVRCHGATNQGTTIPYRWNDYYLDVSADRTNIYICTNADFSGQSCMVKLYYTKN